MLAGSALLAVGALLGVLAGSMLDAPRLLLERLQQPVETVEFDDDAEELDPRLLVEYEALQEEVKSSPKAKSTPRRAPSPEPKKAAATPKATPKPAPVAQSAKAAPPKANAPPRAPQPSAREVIDAIAERVASPVASAPTSGRVVQVGAFPDTRSAQAVVDRLRGQGLLAYLSDKKAKNLHRVRVRPRNGQAVSALASDLKGRGFDVWVTSE